MFAIFYACEVNSSKSYVNISGDAKSLTPTYYWKIGSSSYSSSGASYTFTGLTPNTGYSYSGESYLKQIDENKNNQYDFIGIMPLIVNCED